MPSLEAALLRYATERKAHANDRLADRHTQIAAALPTLLRARERRGAA
jgi:hypothetical protein